MLVGHMIRLDLYRPSFYGHALMEGAQIGAYRVLRQIGEGGMGSVWIAEHVMLGRVAAIKVLHPELSSRAEIVSRFFNEARAAASIRDPGIVQIFDFGQHVDGSAYIVMELLDGEPLDRRLTRHGALGLPEALRIVRQVASTLGAAHVRGIVHRDLKPENIFVVRDPEVVGGERVKILDFGIAKLVGDHGGIKTKTKQIMGTPAFMSPEQCRGAGQVDQRSDVYALGCVLFTLMVGRPPFDAEGSGDIIAMHLREAPPAPSSLRQGLPPEVDQVVLRCLAKDPVQRYANAGEFANALERLLGSALQSTVVAANPAHAAVTQPTTLSTVATAGPRATQPARLRLGVAWVVVSGIGVGGAIAIAVNHEGDGEPASSSPVPEILQSPAVAAVPQATRESSPMRSVPMEPELAPDKVTAPAGTLDTRPAPLPKQPDTVSEIAASMQGVLERFVAWSRDHRGAPCPDVTELGDVPRDPWRRAFRLTCNDQPADQIVGAISAGPDGEPGTSDDITSWRLGQDVTGLVRGARWGVAVPPVSPTIEPPLTADAERKPVSFTPKPATTRPQDTALPKPVPRRDQIELDEFGIPIKRSGSPRKGKS